MKQGTEGSNLFILSFLFSFSFLLSLFLIKQLELRQEVLEHRLWPGCLHFTHFFPIYSEWPVLEPSIIKS